MTDRNILTGLLITVILSVLTVLIISNYAETETEPLKFKLRKELPNGRCIYALSTRPHSKNNGYINTSCIFKDGAEYEIIVNKPIW